LRAYQDALPAIQAAGADLLGIGPQPFDSCCAVAERDLLAFSILSDAGNAVAEQFGVVHEIPPVIQALYLRLGHDLPRLNKTDDWRVPLPATFIIGRDGRVIKSHIASTNHARLEPSEVVRALEDARVHA
jgi:peroxiredoxin